MIDEGQRILPRKLKRSGSKKGKTHINKLDGEM